MKRASAGLVIAAAALTAGLAAAGAQTPAPMPLMPPTAAAPPPPPPPGSVPSPLLSGPGFPRADQPAGAASLSRRPDRAAAPARTRRRQPGKPALSRHPTAAEPAGRPVGAGGEDPGSGKRQVSELSGAVPGRLGICWRPLQDGRRIGDENRRRISRSLARRAQGLGDGGRSGGGCHHPSRNARNG